MKKKLKLKIYPWHLLMLSLGFILFTAIGTVSHEYGHILVAKSLGYETKLHFASAEWGNAEIDRQLAAIHEQNKSAIENEEDFPKKAFYETTINQRQKHSLWVSIGGPAQTMLTGSIGFALLILRRKTTKQNGFKAADWLAVFLSLFWLRQVANVLLSSGSAAIHGHAQYFGGDEANIAHALGWPTGSLAVSSAVIGLLFCVYIIFKLLPQKFRLTFILSGLLGGIAGWFIWMNLVGPGILP